MTESRGQRAGAQNAQGPGSHGWVLSRGLSPKCYEAHAVGSVWGDLRLSLSTEEATPELSPRVDRVSSPCGSDAVTWALLAHTGHLLSLRLSLLSPVSSLHPQKEFSF